MPDAVLVCDRAGRVRLVNPVADRLFAGRPVLDSHDLVSRFQSVPEAAAAGEPVLVRPLDRPNRWFELRSLPIERTESRLDDGAGARGGSIFLLRDVTKGREERAERRAFLSILSHELRTPITTIYAGSRVLAKREAMTPRASQEIAADISAEAARLYDVVEDLLVLTRAEQGVLELADEPVLLQRVIEGAIRIARTRAPDVAINVTGLSDPPSVRGDGLYVEQLVRNLLSAASRFGRLVVVDIAQNDGHVTVSVRDHGPDLSDDEIRTAFNVSETASGPRSGVGITLFVCRRLVEAMDGTIWIRRGPSGGAEIGFMLPLYAESD
jgi:signal transduction histidine kinase